MPALTRSPPVRRDGNGALLAACDWLGHETVQDGSNLRQRRSPGCEGRLAPGALEGDEPDWTHTHYREDGLVA